MRSKKGFTLIELLSVIVILAVIALIAVPIILNMINDARKAAAVDSAYGYIEAIEYQNSMNMLDNKKYKKITDGENLDITSIDSLVKVKGTRPDSGTITIEKGRVKYADLCIDGFNIIYDGKKASATASKKCGSGSDVVEEVIIEDEKPCELKEEAIDDKEYLYIDSVEDMYAFSKSVNNGNSYQGKIVKLRNNLDFSTYKPEEKNSICEINNEQGFSPIGTQNKPFKGTFDGGGKVIKNLTINRPNQSYVGLFGYVTGSEGNFASIYGVRMINDVDDNENIKGSIVGLNYVGTLVGFTNSYVSIKEIELENINVYGGEKIGGLTGDTLSNITNIIVKSGKIDGWNYVGVLSSVNSQRVTNSIVGKVDLKMRAQGGTIYSSLASNNVFYSNLTTYNNNNVDGFDSKGIDDINFYETAGLDTWIGGDDGSGYYFDYDKNGKIILKSIKENPITFNLNKNNEGYYLIKSAKDWKEASSKTNEKYKLETNLDFSKNKYYMLGSIRPENEFTGTLNGNDKTISNVTINGNVVEVLGLIGKVNGGTIHGLTLKNITINGYNFAGIFGYVMGTEGHYARIYGIRVINDLDSNGNSKGRISGNWYVGGLAGYVHSCVSIKEIELENIDVYGAERVGGVSGDTLSSLTNILIKSGKIDGWNYVGDLTSVNSSRVINSIVEKVDLKMRAQGGTIYGPISSNNTFHSNLTTYNNNNVDGFDSSLIGDLDHYTGILETLYDGDKDGSGYFFDYVDDKNGIRLVKAYTPKETATPTEKPNCTVSVPEKGERGCYLYTSGVHGNYLYEAIPASETGTGATCSSTGGRVPAYRYKITYNCS